MTPAQKLKLHYLHSDYMTVECVSSEYDAKAATTRLVNFTEYYESLGLNQREAEKLSWEVCQNYDAVLQQARAA